MSKSVIVQLRVPVALHRAIGKRAEDDRRPWTQMAILLLEDAMAGGSGQPLPPPRLSRALQSKTFDDR